MSAGHHGYDADWNSYEHEQPSGLPQEIASRWVGNALLIIGGAVVLVGVCVASWLF